MPSSRGAHRASVLVLLLAAVALLASCTSTPGPPSTEGGPATAGPAPLPATPPARVCDRLPPGPAQAPEGAVVVDPAVDGDLMRKTTASPPGTTFWLAPGTHTLGADQFGQVTPKDGNVYLGAPGAVLDGRGINRYAFVGTATGVTIKHLTVRGFNPPHDQGVVNHDSGNGWIIEDNAIEENRGAGLMAGADQQVRGNCLRNNGQYGLNAFQPGNGITGLVVEYNEVVGNNTDDWEAQKPGCGCTGGMKFWAVDGADVRGNWIHDNRGPGLWADTNDNDFLIEGNLIENNDSGALFYEASYNLVLRNNVIRSNGIPEGRSIAAKNDAFPQPAVYLSESGGEPRVPARTDKIEIYGNVFDQNWSGITAWENADRFCNSPANTSTGSCTRLVADREQCTQPGIAQRPLYDDCRWKTQRVEVHDNTFVAAAAPVGCPAGFANKMAILSNYGTYPEWSPYKGEVIQVAIATAQDNRWYANTYRGAWTFVVGAVDEVIPPEQWQQSGQDSGSSFEPTDTVPC